MRGSSRSSSVVPGRVLVDSRRLRQIGERGWAGLGEQADDSKADGVGNRLKVRHFQPKRYCKFQMIVGSEWSDRAGRDGIEARGVVEAPRDAVFEFLASLENHWRLADRWIEVLSLERSGERRVGEEGR